MPQETVGFVHILFVFVLLTGVVVTMRDNVLWLRDYQEWRWKNQDAKFLMFVKAQGEHTRHRFLRALAFLVVLSILALWVF